MTASRNKTAKANACTAAASEWVERRKTQLRIPLCTACNCTYSRELSMQNTPILRENNKTGNYRSGNNQSECEWKRARSEHKRVQRRRQWWSEVLFIYEYSYVQFVSYYLLLTCGTFSFVRANSYSPSDCCYYFVLKCVCVCVCAVSSYSDRIACWATKLPTATTMKLYRCYCTWCARVSLSLSAFSTHLVFLLMIFVVTL